MFNPNYSYECKVDGHHNRNMILKIEGKLHKITLKLITKIVPNNIERVSAPSTPPQFPF